MKHKPPISPQQLAEEILWAGSSAHMLIHPDYQPVHSQALEAACRNALADDARNLHHELGALAESMVMRSHFLGVRFEQAYLAACRFFGPYDVHEANLQVIDEGQTLGEFDLLLESANGAVHQELAVKFYLGLPSAAGHYIWFGPGQRDRLDLKLEALLQRQLRLSDDAVAKNLMASLGFAVKQVELVIKGYLFYPFDSTATLPEVTQDNLTPSMEMVKSLLTPDHCRGYWIQKTHLEQLSGFGDHWVILPKAVWLQPAHSAQEALDFHSLVSRIEAYFAAEALEQLSETPRLSAARPLMVASLGLVNGRLVENTRFFITPDDWADRALQHLGPKLR